MIKSKELIELINKAIDSEIIIKDLNPAGLYEPVKYILKIGGKRIRPTLALLAANLFTDNIEELVKPALALEIFHNFTLLHDDIMDDSPVRRGVETVHVKWNNNTAILSGDAMAIMAYKCLESAPVAVYPQVMKVFNYTSLAVCEGQQFDMEFETSKHVSLENYIEMIRLKTAELLAGSLKIGALMGGADDINADLLYNLGINLGIAFQLKDDLLDTFGDFEIFGKRIGNDIIENKKTFLLIKAFELAKGDLLKELQGFYFTPQSDSLYKVKRVTEIFKELNIQNTTELEIELYFKKALQNISDINIDENKKEELKSIAANFMAREK
jgi:geranylgeranyl diphosphate synthase type II